MIKSPMTVDKINKLWHIYTLEHFMGWENQWTIIMSINEKDFLMLNKKLSIRRI